MVNDSFTDRKTKNLVFKPTYVLCTVQTFCLKAIVQLPIVQKLNFIITYENVKLSIGRFKTATW